MSNDIKNQYIRDFHIAEFQQHLLTWFEQEQRDLPWRKDQDPYKVWVSEIMLQQTRVDTVIPYFYRFLEAFPSIEALADAEEEKVLKMWEGLGYYSRARNLQSAVKEVKDKYGGKVPNTAKELSKLKGVGPYTTGAVLSIAYNVPEPAVDGNVMRVMSRILSIWDDIAKPKTRKIFEDIIRTVISKDNPSFFNQGLMELGAIVCTPTSPSCLLCPVQQHCRAFHEGTQNELPVKSKKKKPTAKSMVACIVRDKSGNVLVHKRPEKGLLANLWEFPNHEIVPGITSPQEQFTRFANSEFGADVTVKNHVKNIEHVFSHLIWEISVFEAVLHNTPNLDENLRLLHPSELDKYPFPVSHQKIKIEL